MTQGERLSIGIGLAGIVLAWAWARKTGTQLARLYALQPQLPSATMGVDAALLPNAPVDPLTGFPVGLPPSQPFDPTLLGQTYDPLTGAPIVPNAGMSDWFATGVG